MILVSFQDIPSETIQTKIFTKIRQSQTTLRRKKVTKKIHERDWRLHHNNVSMIVKCPWKCHSELVMLGMLQIYPLDSKRAKVSIVFKWQTALSPFGWFLLNPSKEKHSSNKQVIYDQIFTIIKWNMRLIWLIIFFFFFFLQTDTTNTELKPLFGSFLCKIQSVFTEDNIESVPDAKETVIQGPKEHMLLPYHLVLPYAPGSPRIPVPAGVGCTPGCGANLRPVSIQQVLFFQQEGSKSLPWK